MNELVGGLGYAVKNWWMSLLLGLLYIAVALCLLFAPVSSYVALSVIFSISILVSGVLEVFFFFLLPETKKQSVVGDGILPEVLLIC